MNSVLKLELIKFLITVVLIGLFYLILNLAFGELFRGNQTLDIHLHDSYFVIDTLHFWAILFLLAHFIVNTLFSFNTIYFSHIANTILLIEIFVVYYVAAFIANLWSSFSGGWSSYPPLSALRIEQTSATHQPLFSFSLLTIPFAIYALIFCYRWAQWANNK